MKKQVLFPLLLAGMLLCGCDKESGDSGEYFTQVSCEGYDMHINNNVTIDGKPLQSVKWFVDKIDWDYKMCLTDIHVGTGELDGKQIFIFGTYVSSGPSYEVTDNKGNYLGGAMENIPVTKSDACYIVSTVCIPFDESLEETEGYTLVEYDNCGVYYYDYASVNGNSLQSLDWLAETLCNAFAERQRPLVVSTAKLDGNTVLLINEMYSTKFYYAAYDAAGNKLNIDMMKKAYENGTLTEPGYACQVRDK